MLAVLCSGVLIRDPQERVSASGNTYCTALVRVPCEGEDALICSVIAFNGAAVHSLMALAKGDAVSIAGRARLSTWERDGEQRHGLSIVAEQVLTLYALGKRRKASREPSPEC